MTEISPLPSLLAQKVFEALQPLARGQAAYGLLDFPNHGNIGDSAIWAGEVALLRRVHGRGPAYVSHMRYPVTEPGRILPAGSTLYLHGGGNFGDIWPVFQNYREAVIAANPQYRIVQLPQSLHYAEPDAIERTKRVIGAHPDFHMMVRDHQSHAFVQQHFRCPVQLVPDSAFGIDMSRVPRSSAPKGILALLRSDKEVRPDAAEGHRHFQDVTIADWQQQNRRGIEKGTLGLFRALPFRAAQGLRARAFDAMVDGRVALGFAQLDQAEVVVTDRLHGHIMATLLGKPHVVIDNFYGKIANFIAAFGKDDVTLQARDYTEARDMADSLLQKVRQAP